MGKKDIISDEVLCAEYQSLYRYALSITRNEGEAQDITQETFLKAMKNSGKFTGESSLYTWLCAIAKNLWLNKQKKSSREVRSEDIEKSLPDTAISLEHRLEEKDFAIQIHRVLHTINEPYKEVFTLRIFGELPFSSIASLFNKTESWARVTFHRGRKIIIEQLRKDDLL